MTVDLLATQLAYALDGDLLPLFDVDCEQLSRWADVGAHEAPQEVVDRLAQLSEQDTSWWRFLGDWRVQELVDALGGVVNMDFYQVRIDLPDGQDELAFFEEVRTHLGGYLDPTIATFELYPGDEERWENGPILGTVAKFGIQPDGPNQTEEEAAVVASLYETESHWSRWRFSTLWASWFALGHPVSGTREFGAFTSQETGHHYIYTRGVDRVEGPASSLANLIFRRGNGGIVFDGGDRLWRSFQQSVFEEVRELGGIAEAITPLIYQPKWSEVRAYFERRVTLSELLAERGCVR